MVAGSLGDGPGTSLRGRAVTFSSRVQNLRAARVDGDARPSESDFQEEDEVWGPSQPNQSSHGGGLEQFITGRAEELLISAL